MPGIDYAIYFVHGLFWAPFGVARLIARRQAPAGDAPAAAAESTAPFSRTLIGIHAFAFALMYFGLARAVMPGRVPRWFPGQRVVGAVIIIGGGLLMGWAVASFESWRFRAALAAGHRLATGGPFRAIRHPIYLGLFLLALGTAIWVPAPIVWAGCVVMAVGSDLRARAEEKLLTGAFGPAYRDYVARSRRFIPGVY